MLVRAAAPALVRLYGAERLEDRTLLSVTAVNASYGANHGSTPRQIVDVNGTTFFTTGEGTVGGLWKTDGTESGTVLLDNFGSTGINAPQNLIKVGSTLFFTEGDSTNGIELWKSDGTTEGTKLVKDIAPGLSSSSPGNFLNANGILYFSATDGKTGVELWKSDGTDVGTVIVKDIAPNGASSSPMSLALFNGAVYFTAFRTGTGSELYKSGGTSATTAIVTDLNPGTPSASPSSLCVAGNSLYFTATDPTHGTELFKTDGTTVTAIDVVPGTASSAPSNLVNYNGTLYFSATSPATGSELWKSDGTTSTLVKDLRAGTASSSPTGLTVANNLLFFAANGGTGSGITLWSSDGSAAGTNALSGKTPTSLTAAGGKIYFSAFMAATGTELWSSDGSAAGTAVVKDIFDFGGEAKPTALAISNGKVLFSADDGQHGEELFISDGTSAGTTLVKDINTAAVAGTPTGLLQFNGRLYFNAPGGFYQTDGTTTQRVMALTPTGTAIIGSTLYFSTAGGALWRTDGTHDGTSIVKQFATGLEIGQLTAFNGKLYMTYGTNQEAYESDLTGPGTQMLQGPTGTVSAPKTSNFQQFGNHLYFFSLTDPSSRGGGNIWRTDGTAAGTGIFTPAAAKISANGSLVSFVEVNGVLLYLNIDSGVENVELWRSDGTVAGTSVVKDLNGPGAASINLDENNAGLALYNGQAYFNTNTAVPTPGFYTSDGTAQGTVRVAVTDPFDPMPSYGLMKVGNLLYFVEEHGQSSTDYDLWRSDGTTQGTIMVGQFPGMISNMRDVKGILYFRASKSGSGNELWRSDGTADGTVLAADIAPGSASSNPGQLTVVGNSLYFTANDQTNGIGIWRLDLATAAPSTPVGFTAAAASATNVNLSWSDPGATAVGFLIERSLFADFATIDDRFSVGNGATSFSDEVVEPLTHYYYRITASNDAGSSAPASTSVDTPAIVVNPGVIAPLPSANIWSNVVILARHKHQLYLNGYKTAAQKHDFVRVDPNNWEVVGGGGGGAEIPAQIPDFPNRFVYYGTGGLYTTDGRAAGDTEIRPFNSINSAFVNFGGKLYFLAAETDTVALWTTDGTVAGTTPVDIAADKRLAFVYNSLSQTSVDDTLDSAFVGGTLYYADFVSGLQQVFRTDGTAGNTVQLTNFSKTGSGPANPVHFINADGTVYFFTRREVGLPIGFWKTDGTPQGTVQVKSIAATRFGPLDPVAANGTLYFSDGYSLWGSDGTDAGTAILHTFGNNPNASDPFLQDLTALNGRLYFGANVSDQGQLWTSDGTVGGTAQVAGLPYLDATIPSQLITIDNTLYFVADVGSGTGQNGKLLQYTPLSVPLPTPLAPSGLTATASSNGEIDLTWIDASHNERGFRIERSSSPTFDTIDATASVLPNTTTYVDLGLTSGQGVYYRVIAFNDGGDSAAATVGPVTTHSGPAGPTDLSVTNGVPGERVDLSWNDNAINEDSYIVQRSTSPAFFPADSIALNVTLPANSTSYQDTSVDRLTTYYYRVYAANTVGNSEAATGDIQTPESRPKAPTQLQSAGVSATEIDLQWTDNAVNEGANGYRVERAGSDGVFVQIAQLPRNTTAYADTTPSGTGTLMYRVRAVNSVGVSDYAVTSAQVVPPNLVTPVAELPILPTTDVAGSADPSTVVTVNGIGFFLATDASTGPAKIVLARTDGTVEGTFALHTFGDVLTQSLGGAGNQYYFTVTNRTSGAVTLWASDGTDVGTHAVKNIMTVDLGSASNPEIRVAVGNGGTLFFTVQLRSDDGTQLWTSDGTNSGTNTIGTFPSPIANLVNQSGAVYFSAAGVTYQSDGTTVGTAATGNFIAGITSASRVVAGGKTYFIKDKSLYVNSGTLGSDVLLSAGGAVGTPTNSIPADLTVVGDKVVYSTQHLINSVLTNELWLTAGVPGDSVLLMSHTTPGQTAFTDVIAIGAKVYFGIPTYPKQLWVSDLTPQGTKQVTTVPQTMDHFGAVGNYLTFEGDVATQLWSSDGTAAGTQAITSFGTQHLPAHPDYMLTVGNEVYFVSSPKKFIDYDETSGGQELWKTDGTAEGTERLFVGNVRDLTEFNGSVYFAVGRQIWKTDGTTQGTQLVFEKSTGGVFVRLMTAFAGRLFFGGGDQPGGYGGFYELWSTDGTAEGTTRFGDVRVFLNFTSFATPKFSIIGGYLYFLNADNGFGFGNLWRTDGTLQGTVPISGVTSVVDLTAIGTTLYCVGNDPNDSLYRVNYGDTSATLIKGPITPLSSTVRNLTNVGGTLYFNAPQGENGMALWKSDGTADGTIPVIDPSTSTTSDSHGGGVVSIFNFNGTAYFIFDDQSAKNNGTLWRSDGTPEGTVRIRSFTINNNYANPVFFEEVAGKLVFCDGNFLWRTDGTFGGTVQIDELVHASDGSTYNGGFAGAARAVLGDQVLFSSAALGGGRELFIANLNPPAAPDGLTISNPDGGAAPQGLTQAQAAPPASGTQLQWVDRATTESGYVIDRSVFANFSVIDASFYLAPDATSFTDTTANGNTYYYRVRSVNAGGWSDASNVAESTAPVSIQSVVVGDGTAERSKISQLTVVFNQDVNLAAGALTLVGRNGAGAGTVLGWTNPSGDGRTWLVSFSGATMAGGSLADGVYDLTVQAGNVHAGSLTGATLAANFGVTFHRLFGDLNGDKIVNNADLFKFNQSYLKTPADAGYQAAFDYDGNGVINNVDNFQFSKQYLKQLNY